MSALWLPWCRSQLEACGLRHRADGVRATWVAHRGPNVLNLLIPDAPRTTARAMGYRREAFSSLALAAAMGGVPIIEDEDALMAPVWLSPLISVYKFPRVLDVAHALTRDEVAAMGAAYALCDRDTLAAYLVARGHAL